MVCLFVPLFSYLSKSSSTALNASIKSVSNCQLLFHRLHHPPGPQTLTGNSAHQIPHSCLDDVERYLRTVGHLSSLNRGVGQIVK